MLSSHAPNKVWTGKQVAGPHLVLFLAPLLTWAVALHVTPAKSAQWAALVALIVLAAIVVPTDLARFHIAKVPCYIAGVVGVCLAAQGFLMPIPTFSIGTVLIELGLCAWVGIAWLVRVGGYGDVRLVIACTLLTAWWVTPDALLIGLLAAFVYAAVMAIFARHMTTTTDRGKRAMAAGPIFLALFIVAGIVTILGSTYVIVS